MIVVLCDSFSSAQKAFDFFMCILECDYPGVIRRKYESELCVETDDDLRYIFVDWRMSEIFREMTPDIMDEEDFFEGLEDWR